MTHDLGRAAWPETDRGPLLLVPVGSVELHGPALPLTTDTTVASAVDVLLSEGRAASWAACAAPGSDAHAGLTETSLLLHLAPQTVRVDLLEPGDTRPVTELMPALRSRGVRAVSANGVLGDPTGASAEEGRRVLDVMVDRVVAEVAG